jgi:hypothetical protein
LSLQRSERLPEVPRRDPTQVEHRQQWNTVYLGRALDAARRRGDRVPDALLAHFAPLGWQHLNLTGDYL